MFCSETTGGCEPMHRLVVIYWYFLSWDFKAVFPASSGSCLSWWARAADLTPCLCDMFLLVILSDLCFFCLFIYVVAGSQFVLLIINAAPAVVPLRSSSLSVRLWLNKHFQGSNLCLFYISSKALSARSCLFQTVNWPAFNLLQPSRSHFCTFTPIIQHPAVIYSRHSLMESLLKRI